VSFLDIRKKGELMEKNSETNLFTEKKEEIKEMVQLFIRSGLIEDESIAEEKIRKAKRNKNKRVYHNTKLMMEQYRKLAWVVKSFPEEIAMELNEEFEQIDKLIERLDVEMAFGKKRLEQKVEGIAQARLILERINIAVNSLRKFHENGELLYQIMYRSYITPNKKAFLEIAADLSMSEPTYYRLRSKAFSLLSNRIWTGGNRELSFWIEMYLILTT